MLNQELGPGLDIGPTKGLGRSIWTRIIFPHFWTIDLARRRDKIDMELNLVHTQKSPSYHPIAVFLRGLVHCIVPSGQLPLRRTQLPIPNIKGAWKIMQYSIQKGGIRTSPKVKDTPPIFFLKITMLISGSKEGFLVKQNTLQPSYSSRFLLVARIH